MTFDQWQTPTLKHVRILDRAKKFHAKELKSKSMFFHGPTGTGKTSLALALRDEAHEEGRLAMYLTVQDIIAKCKRCMEPGSVQSVQSYIDMLCNYRGLLIVDEIGRTKGDDWDKNQVLYPVIDKRLDRYNLWISNYSLEDLSKHYDPAISSRMQVACIGGFKGLADYRKGLPPAGSPCGV